MATLRARSVELLPVIYVRPCVTKRAIDIVGAAAGASTLSNLLWNMGIAPVAAGWLFLAMYPLLTVGLMGLTKAASGPPDRERRPVVADPAHHP